MTDNKRLTRGRLIILGVVVTFVLAFAIVWLFAPVRALRLQDHLAVLAGAGFFLTLIGGFFTVNKKPMDDNATISDWATLLLFAVGTVLSLVSFAFSVCGVGGAWHPCWI